MKPKFALKMQIRLFPGRHAINNNFSEPAKGAKLFVQKDMRN